MLDTGLTRSGLVGKSIRRAKEGHTLGRLTLTLFYATDFADRLENEMIPALRAGFIVLTDRYIFSLMARALVRGADEGQRHPALRHWNPVVVGVFVDDLGTRVVREGFNYWESGMDLHLGEDRTTAFECRNACCASSSLAAQYNFQSSKRLPISKVSQ